MHFSCEESHMVEEMGNLLWFPEYFNRLPTVTIIIGSRHHALINKTYHYIGYFKLSVDNPVSAANDQKIKDNKQNNTTGDSSLKMILGIKDDNLLDEVATLDVIESPANDILMSDAGSWWYHLCRHTS